MFCPNCGKPIDDNSVFCPECGAKVGTAPVSYAAPAAPAKKGLSKGALIGIIAGGVAAVALALVLILTLSGPKGKLVGKWTYSETFYGITVEMKLNFKAGGKGSMEMNAYGETESHEFNWKVDGKKNLIITDDDGDKTTLTWSKDAKTGDDDCWYIEGRTLYLDGMELTKG